MVRGWPLAGVDLGVIIKAFYEDRGLLVRGLAHPALFRDPPGDKDDEIIFTEDEALFSMGFSVAGGRDSRWVCGVGADQSAGERDKRPKQALHPSVSVQRSWAAS